MGLWDKVTDWFTKEEAVYDIDAVKEKEKKLLEKLAELNAQAAKKDEAALESGLQSLLPEKPDYTKRPMDSTSDADIEQKYKEQAGDTLETGKQNLNDKYAASESGIESDIGKNTAEAARKTDAYGNEAKKLGKAATDGAIRNNLTESSVYPALLDRIDEEKQLKIGVVVKNLQSELNDAEQKLKKLESEKANALERFETEYAKELDSQISKAVKERDKKNAEAQAYNDKLKVMEADFIRKNEDSAQKYKSAFWSQIRERDAQEKKYGYTGKRAEDYDNRLNIALEFYGKYPKKVALGMLAENQALRQYLGSNFNSLLRRTEER